jgi:SAM-dependent methyltransferase
MGLGAGRAPELDLVAPTGPIDAAKWVIIDSRPMEDAVYGRPLSSHVERRRASALEGMADAASRQETFDLIYAVDTLDTMRDDQALAVIEQASALLSPNGRVVVSAFAPDLPEASYLDAVLDWRPRLRDEVMLGQLIATAAHHRDGRSIWRGGSDRVVFGMIERQSWAT